LSSSRRIAGKSEIGMLIKPKLMAPFQMALIFSEAKSRHLEGLAVPGASF